MGINFVKKPRRKKLRTFTIDDDIYNNFKKACEEHELNMSETLREFMKRASVVMLDERGGEVVFGVEGTEFKQPKKIIYDGKEIKDRDGIRQKEEGNK